MKKFIYSALCLCVFLSFMGCNDNTKKPKVEDSGLTGKISDNIEFRVSDDNSKIWLDNSHIEKISLELDENGKKTLTFTTTEEGKTLLYNATNENIGKIISVGADKYLLSAAMVMVPNESGVFTLNHQFVDYAYLYNYLTDAEDKMNGVTPPNDLISEDTAKNKVFEHANTTVDKVEGLSVELKIDEDHFDWKYCINFTVNGNVYLTEVNAHTGGIIKFWAEHYGN